VPLDQVPQGHLAHKDHEVLRDWPAVQVPPEYKVPRVQVPQVLLDHKDHKDHKDQLDLLDHKAREDHKVLKDHKD
jgi:hypothetical protein